MEEKGANGSITKETAFGVAPSLSGSARCSDEIASDVSVSIKMEYDEDTHNELPDQLQQVLVTVKTDPVPEVKHEMYVDHEFKEDMVFGPTELLKSVTGFGYQDHSSTQPREPKTSCETEVLLCKEEPIDTSICDKKFTNKSSNKPKVLSLIHSNEFPCNFCYRTFLSELEYTSHKTIHTGLKLFYCEVCDKSFASIESLTQHSGLHGDSKRFSCDKCDKKFFRKKDLSQHLYGHKKIKPYACEVCRKRFVLQYQLIRHMQIHSDLKRLQCDICKKYFKTKTNISRHLLIHSGDKPYSCKQCEARFIHAGNLTLHMAKHSEKRPFICKLCHKAYKCNWNLVRHMKAHSKNTCQVCNIQFKRVKSLLNHHCTGIGPDQVSETCGPITIEQKPLRK